MIKIVIILLAISALLFIYAYLAVEPIYAELSALVLISTVIFAIIFQIINLVIKNISSIVNAINFVIQCIENFISKIFTIANNSKNKINYAREQKELIKNEQKIEQQEQSRIKQNEWSL